MVLFGQVVASCLIVMGVLWFMWRLPHHDDSSLWGVAPWLSLGGVWAGLLAVAGSLMMWWITWPDGLLVLLFLLLEPAAIAAGVLVLWIYRGEQSHGRSQTATIHQQRLQACAAVALGLLAVLIGYFYVMTHKPLFTPVGL